MRKLYKEFCLIEYSTHITMVIKISEKNLTELILEVVSKKKMTIFEISDAIGFQQNSIRTQISRLKELGLIRESGFYKRRYKVYEIPNIAYDTDNPFLNTSYNPIDTEILKIMLLPFAKRNMICKFTSKQSERVKYLFSKTYNKKGERINGR